MPRAAVNGVELEYQIRGRGRPLVMIMGIGAQLVAWPDGFLSELERHGLSLILFDNRDSGLSTKLDHLRTPPMRSTIVRAFFGLPIQAPYTLVDMADDTAGLIEHLGFESAHVLGVSLGGMVAQTLAICHPRRVRTLTSVMSHTGHRFDALGKPRALMTLLGGKAPRSRQEAIERNLQFLDTCGSKVHPYDRDEAIANAGRAYDRCFYPRGFARQALAVAATGDRAGALRFVRAPTLVIHGADDPLIRPVGGRRTARMIPGARLEIIEGMGHDLPRPLWPRLAELIAGHVEAHARSQPLPVDNAL